MLTLETLVLRNFMSIGAVDQTININHPGLTLILGENLDKGGNGSRNGVGKSTIIQAISFALFGQPLLQIKRDNLINKVNGKGLFVSLTFSMGKKKYRVERGRKPNFVKWFVNNEEQLDPDQDETQGDSNFTQKEIDKCLGMTHQLFKHIIALHVKSVPFLSLPSSEQGKIIEELLGIRRLRNKSDQLKDLIRQTKEEVKLEEVRIRAVLDSNEKIKKAIDECRLKSGVWEKENERKIKELEESFWALTHLDIDAEIKSHNLLIEWNQNEQALSRLMRESKNHTRSLTQIDSSLDKISLQVEKTAEAKCPTCGHGLHEDKMGEILEDFEKQIYELSSQREVVEHDELKVQAEIEKYRQALENIGEKPTVFYPNLEEAYNHRSLMDQLQQQLNQIKDVENPYIEQIVMLNEKGLQDVEYDYLNGLNTLLEHQEFLNKLLTNNESFIRKKIIDQNLSFLNTRLNNYLDKLGLPHEVVFQSDLSVSITRLGREFDFEQLSGGESNRLVLALSWAFRDVWESLNHSINILFIDELVDSGLDASGMDASLEILKHMGREKNKSVFLISHKDDLTSRVNKILLVQMENGFTNFVMDHEIQS